MQNMLDSYQNYNLERCFRNWTLSVLDLEVSTGLLAYKLPVMLACPKQNVSSYIYIYLTYQMCCVEKLFTM